MKSRRWMKKKKSQKKSKKKNDGKKSVRGEKNEKKQQHQQQYYDSGIIKEENGIQVFPSLDNPRKQIFIDFGMDKVSDDDVSLNYWMKYGKCQDYVTKTQGVRGIHIDDGISSFNIALDIVPSIKRKDKDVDVYVVYAYSSSFFAKKTEELLSEFSGLTISDDYNNDDINKCKKAVEESKILMSFVLFVKKGCPISTHIGIFKNSVLFSPENSKRNVKNLSLYLHSYSCWVTSKLYPEVEYIITRPVPAMSYILYSNLKDRGEGSIYYGSQYERNIRNQHNEYIAKVKEISKFDKNIENIKAEINWDEVIGVVTSYSEKFSLKNISLDDITKAKLKVYFCLNPLEAVDAFSSLADIQMKVNHIEFVTEENLNVLNEKNINVIRDISLTVNPLLNNYKNIDYYIDHDLLNNDQLNAISLESVVFYGFQSRILLEPAPAQYNNCRGKISFRGMTSLEYVGDNWLKGTLAREIDFRCLNNLEKVGDYWLTECTALMTVDFTGLNNLEEVGYVWLAESTALVNVDFKGLSNLKKVGNAWLRGCKALETVIFKGLINLKEVGSHWLSDCEALTTVNFEGLSNLEKVGTAWLSDCTALTTANFTGLSNLEKVGMAWLSDCTALTTANFTGLSNLEKVGSHWLNKCTALTDKVNFTGLNKLKEVGNYWLADCTALTTANFTGLSNLEKVGSHWLYGCRALTRLIWTDLNNLKEVRGWWLHECTSLTTANFSGLSNLEEVGHGWLSDCTALTTVILTDLNNLKEVGSHWLSDCDSLDKSLIDFTPLTSLRQIGYIYIRNIDDIRRIMVVG